MLICEILAKINVTKFFFCFLLGVLQLQGIGLDGNIRGQTKWDYACGVRNGETYDKRQEDQMRNSQ